jgi:1,4-dihydroxy-2-naphthoate octaprenyltransferase
MLRRSRRDSGGDEQTRTLETMSNQADQAVPDAHNRWVLAARPRTLPAAVAPVLVGTGLAIRDEAFRWDVLVVTMLAALAIQVGVNFANDVADATRGADTQTRIGPTRAVAAGLITPEEMWRGIGLVFGLAAAGGVYLASIAGPLIIVIGLASLIAALGYTNGPFPYGYYGLGEMFVFVFFGLVATVGTRYAFDGSVGAGAWEGGIAMGLLASAILVANNVRDLDTDRAAGKRTLAVILGRRVTRGLYATMVLGAFAVVVLGVATGAFPPPALAALLALPLAVPAIRAVATETSGPPLIAALESTGRVQLAVAVLLLIAIGVG